MELNLVVFLLALQRYYRIDVNNNIANCTFAIKFRLYTD